MVTTEVGYFNIPITKIRGYPSGTASNRLKQLPADVTQTEEADDGHYGKNVLGEVTFAGGLRDYFAFDLDSVDLDDVDSVSQETVFVFDGLVPDIDCIASGLADMFMIDVDAVVLQMCGGDGVDVLLLKLFETRWNFLKL